jgi:hypothetical protein
VTWDRLSLKAFELLDRGHNRYGVIRNGENLAALVHQVDAHRPPKGY